MVTLRYILRDTARILIRHWILGFLTLMTAAVMMWILGLATLFSLNIQSLLLRLERDLIVQAYIHKDSNPESVAVTIRRLPIVADVRSVSPDDALARLQARMGSQAKALDLIGENPLQWSLEIHVTAASGVQGLVRNLMSMPEIEDVVYSGMVVERLSSMSKMADSATLTMFLLSIMITSLVVYNTTHISLYSRRDEISIMFLIGATRSYIATPFVLEGTLLSLFGAAMAALGIVFTYFPGVRILQSTLPFLEIVADRRVIAQFCALLVAFGGTLGWLCSCLVALRFMNSAAKPL
ncbi:cell division protein FtsX [Synergistales bacterium]|nr:cell division protein FtsX [Synergistales bacterium]